MLQRFYQKIELKFSKRYLIVPMLLLVFFILFYFIYENIKDRMINEFNKEQTILAQTAAQGITNFFKDYQADITFLTQLTGIIDFNEDGKELIQKYYENRKHLIAAITRVDEHGIIIYTYPYDSAAIGRDISSQKHVVQLMQTQKPVLSDVFFAVQGYSSIAMHIPIFQRGEFKGSVAILFPIDKIGNRYLKKIKIRGTGSVWLLSENLVEIYCPFPEHIGKSYLDNADHHPKAIEFSNQLKSEHTGTAISVHYQKNQNEISDASDQHIVFYRAPLGNTYWTIAISFKDEDIYAQIYLLRAQLLVILAILFLFVLYFFYSNAKMRAIIKEEIKRKKAEKTLHESEEKFKTIFDESPIGIELYNSDGIFVSANKADLDIFGLDNIEMLKGQKLFNNICFSEEQNRKLLNSEIITYQTEFDFDELKKSNQCPSQRNGKAYFDFIITPLLDTETKIINGYLLQVQDITKRKNAEEELLMLAHALRSVNESVSITDMNDRFIFVNDSFTKTYGYTLEDLQGKKVDFIRPVKYSLQEIDEIYEGTISGGWKGELINIRKDGTEFPIYLSTTIILDKEGKQLGLIGVASDITERKSIEKELIDAKLKAEESDRLKSAFLANMSHEIRTPMNGIMGFASLLKEPDISKEEQEMYIDVINRSGHVLLHIINDLIDISKIEAGQMDAHFSIVNLNEQLQFLHSFFQTETEKKGMVLSINPPIGNEIVSIRTDKEKLHAVLTNLIKNAIKYSREGYIEFGYHFTDEDDQKLVKFHVKDTGIGISEEKQLIIFDRFFQAEKEDSKVYEGAGLGLAISKAYVELLGGSIWVESQIGKGSAFYFTIPLE